ncbi:MAG TPA: hypothetical protein VHS36_06305 [Candidatus Limnocylindrales bacterium]|nr:hypothetical protein [Candidatus Limnocylindrales bacterium]
MRSEEPDADAGAGTDSKPPDSDEPPIRSNDRPSGGGYVRRQRVFLRRAERGIVRRRIAVPEIRMSDAPDEHRSREIMRLDLGDEVEVLAHHGAYLWVRTPTGEVGWIADTAMPGDDRRARRR